MKLFLLTIAFLTTLTCFSQSAEYKKMLDQYYDGFPTISIEEALKHLEKKDAIFLDIREIEEYNVSHIEGAKRMNPNNLSFSTLKNIRENQLIIVYCSVGARSQSFGKMLKKHGFENVFNLYGGLFYWANMHYPMVNNQNEKTDQIHGFSPEWGKWVTEGTVVY